LGCYLVTGGAGFIGSAIARRLVEEGRDVVVVDDLSTGAEGNVPPGAELVVGSLANSRTYAGFNFGPVDAVLHLGGQSSGEVSHEDPLYDFEANAKGAFLLLRWCESERIRRVLYSSSMAVYGPSEIPVQEGQPPAPCSFYGASKAAAEVHLNYFARRGGEPTIFRLFNVYGPGQNLKNEKQGMVSIYLAYLLNREPVLVKGVLERYRDFLYIDDLVEAWVSSIHDSRTFSKVYNLGSAQKTTVRHLLSALIEAFGYEDYPIRQEAGTPGDILGNVADIAAIRGDIGWEPKTELSDGLKRMVKWALENEASG